MKRRTDTWWVPALMLTATLFFGSSDTPAAPLETCTGGNTDVPYCLDLGRASRTCDLNGFWNGYLDKRLEGKYWFDKMVNASRSWPNIYRVFRLAGGRKVEVGTLTQTPNGYYFFNRIDGQPVPGGRGVYKHTNFVFLYQSAENCNRMEERFNASSTGTTQKTYTLRRAKPRLEPTVPRRQEFTPRWPKPKFGN